MRRQVVAMVLWVAGLGQVACAQSTPVIRPDTISHGLFSCAVVYKPTVNVRGTVLMLVDSRGQKGAACKAGRPAAWSSREERLALVLAADGILVAGLDMGPLIQDQAKSGSCLGFDGDLENISRVLEARYQLPGYRPPVLFGSGAAGVLVQAQLAAAVKGTYSGGISSAPASSVTLPLSFCKGRALVTTPAAYDHVKQVAQEQRTRRDASYTILPASTLGAPWEVMLADAGVAREWAAHKDVRITGNMTTGSDAEVTGVRDAVRRMLPGDMQQRQVTAVSDLPLVEMPAGSVQHHDVLVVMVSGDGGWAGIDKDIAGLLVKAGMPVVGFDSLRYFWKARTPQTTTRDIERVVQYYQQQPQWHRKKVLLIGYSQGANVMPFVLNRLMPALRSQLAGVVLLGLGKQADFEFHVSNWISSSKDSLPTVPELEKLPAGLALCIYGVGDKESVCPSLAVPHSPVKLVSLPGDHHFNGKYEDVVRVIMEHMQ